MEIIYKHKKKLSRTVILQLLSFPISVILLVAIQDLSLAIYKVNPHV